MIRLQRHATRFRLRGRCRQDGYTLTELVVVSVILVSLSAVLFPTARFTVQRFKEEQLREALREMRNAIDEYKRYSDASLLQIELGTDGYPSEIEQLLEAHQLIGQGPDTIKRFLRRIPVDPMTGEAEWGTRSYQDDWDADSWGGENIFDIHSLSEEVGLDGVPYQNW